MAQFTFSLNIISSSPPLVTSGDSTVATNGAGQAAIATLVTYLGTITDIAHAGDTIANQKTAWQALSSGTRSAAGAVMIEVGHNDMVTGAESNATVIARLQDLVNTVHADAASAKIFCAYLTPAKQRYIDLLGSSDGATAAAKRLAFNAAISGGGTTPITGLTGYVTAHEPLLNDGSDNLAASYDSGDHIHPNASGRQIIANAWGNVLVSNGLP